jgi:hypothetical protein
MVRERIHIACTHKVEAHPVDIVPLMSEVI